MNQPSDIKRLADATAAFASTVMEIITNRLEAVTAVQEQKIAHKMLEPLLTKKQAAEYFQVSLRTIEVWLQRGHLPHYRIGRNVRIRMSDVETWWNERYVVRRRSW